MMQISMSLRALGSIPRGLFRVRVKSAAIRAVATRAVSLDPASQSIECLYQATFGEGRRAVAVIGVVPGVGATTAASALASRCALGGRRTLLLDASGEIGTSSTPPEGTPHARAEYDRVVVLPSANDIFKYRSPEFLRQLINDVHGDYQCVVVDGAPAIERDVDAIPGRLIARSVDAVLLVCIGGGTTSEIARNALESLSSASVRGIVINGRDQPTVGAEIAREAMRLRRFLPGIARRIAARAERSRFLNVHA